MRKCIGLMLVALLSSVSINVSAQEVRANVQVVNQKEQQDVEEIKLADLPEVVKNTLAEKYAKHTLVKALKAKKDGLIIYYIKLQQSEEYETIMIDEKGNVIVPENKSKK